MMLKVEPQFKLDHSSREPYRVYTVTDTCAHIQPINKPNDDPITVSLQRLSCCCSGQLGTAKPWMGHGSVVSCGETIRLRIHNWLRTMLVPHLLIRVHRQHIEGDQSRSRQDIVCQLTATPKYQLPKRGKVVRKGHVRVNSLVMLGRKHAARTDSRIVYAVRIRLLVYINIVLIVLIIVNAHYSNCTQGSLQATK